MKTFTLDASILHTTKLRSERITVDDVWLIDRYGIKQWNGEAFDHEDLVRYSKWVVNDDKSVIFKCLGGGALEVPEMYDLIYKGVKVHLECGGGNDSAYTFLKHADNSYDMTIFVKHIWIPPALSAEQDSVLASIVEAFAARNLGPAFCRTLTVQFNL